MIWKILILFVLGFLWKQRKYYILSWKLTGTIGLPFLGSVFEIRNCEGVIKYLTKIEETHTSPYTIWLGPKCLLVSSDPETMETILTSSHCVNKNFVYRFLTDFIGDGLFTSSVPLWKSRSKMMKPAFKRKIILSFFEIFNQQSENFVKQIGKNMHSEEFDIHRYIQMLTLETTFETAIGDKTALNGVDFSFYLDRFESLMYAVIDRIFHPLLYDSRIYKLTARYNSVIKKRDEIFKLVEKKMIERKERIELDNNNKMTSSLEEDDMKPIKGAHTFLDYVFSKLDSEDMSMEDIRDETIVLIAAGFETTAVAIYITILCLSMHPEEQEILFEELSAVFPDPNFEVTEENVKDLVYTEMCINESLRIIAPVPVVGRLTTKDVVLNNGTVIPEGTDLLLDIFNMQRSTKHWGAKAKKFNPENFRPETTKNRHPYSYIPFTKGSRMCIGFKYSITLMKILLAKVFRNYKITTESKFEDLIFIENISMKIKNHPKFIIEKRVLT